MKNSADDLDSMLDRMEALYEAEDLEQLKREVRRARKLYPGAPEPMEWEAIVAADEERFEEALRILDQVLAADPLRPLAARERAQVLTELWRFEEARDQLLRLLDPLPDEWTREDEADARFELGSLLDRQGDSKAALREFEKAAKLDPDDFSVPPCMAAEEFAAAVTKAVDSIPRELAPYLLQVTVVVEDYPPRDAPSPSILGLYSGLPRTERSHDDRDHLDTVFIFKRIHELMCLEPAELREEIRKTVIHEIAHHFGLGEEDMGEYE